MDYDKDSIQTRLLSNISDNYDKSEGQFIYDALKPVAIELESLYTIANGILDKSFADTATGKNLDRIVKEVGLTRKVTTQSYGAVTITGVVGSSIDAGELVSSDNANFTFSETTVIPASGVVDVQVTCTSYGTIGNVPIGAIKYFPKTLAGLQSVTNSIAISNGADEESDATLRSRFYVKVRTPATSGNKYEYLNWALSVSNVGNARVIPIWNGNGTVKVIIINSNMAGADATLITEVAEYIEEHCPIFATVTVVSAIEVPLNITVTLVISEISTTVNDAITSITSAVDTYLKSIAFSKDYVSYAKIGAIILDTVGVTDYSNLLVNGGSSNVTISNEQVAIIGGVVNG